MPAAQTATSSPTISATSSASLDPPAVGVVDLDALGLLEARVEAVGQRLREGAAAEREHARALDAAAAHEGDVRRAAADVDEERARLSDLLARDGARHGVGLGHDLDELEAELLDDRLQGAQVDERRVGVEDRDAQVAALEADRVGDHVAVHAGAGHGGVDEAHVDVGQAGLPGDGALRLRRGIGLHLLEEASPARSG